MGNRQQQKRGKKWKGVNLVWLRWGNYSFPPLHCTPIMIINKLKVLEEHWELVANNIGPGKEGWMVGWRKRIGRMGNHYANEAGLNHTVPMIICWEEPRLLGSLVCSTAGTHFFCVFSLPDFSLFFSFFLYCSFLTYSLLRLSLCVCGIGFEVTGVHTASTFRHGSTGCIDFKMWI